MLPGPVHPVPGPVAGYVGADVPVELLTAAGYTPVRLAGSPSEDASPGRAYLGGGLDPVACSILTRLLAGTYGPLDVLVVSRDCEASLRLFYVLRELHRVTDVALPPVHLVDVLHLPHRTTTRYVLAKVREFRSWLGGVDDAALADAVVAHDRLRARVREIGALRAQRRLTGTEMLDVVRTACTRPVAEVLPLLDTLLTELAERPARPGHPIHLTGSSHDDPAVYAALEDAGLLVVGEDHDRGDLWALGDVGLPDPGRLELALAERYQSAGPAAPRASIRDRAAHTAAAVRDRGAEGLLSYVRRFDDGPPWDFPAQRAAAGVPAVLVDRQDYGGVDAARVVRELHLAVAA
ncbi:2-hydroxyacyl-CoA dehydratase family protein [Pseudonocardia sp. HH130630-07]|uniref:2-hydroxyacyl-CoA dehydratase family protein n=1 Tax=Pseudonocardia sp. HH130630-07 TaxID=1690815 RepID=UPI000814D49E|nr:2-hydroxyacyl-CoA dehydratase family protein [Pseudonocardia sp. HH130630-07]ANY08894.1 benzoyl-CoA reductase [Pseudonocardia sp. HH130630-07]